MTTETLDSAVPSQPSPWASRIAVTAVHFFILVLFLKHLPVDTWAAIQGFLAIHAAYRFRIFQVRGPRPMAALPALWQNLSPIRAPLGPRPRFSFR